MRIDLRCKLRAYAKLSVNGGQGGGDDYLKLLLSSQANTLIDLGYKDADSGHEVYAIRRVFDFNVTRPSETTTYRIKLGKNIEKVFTKGGDINTLSNNYHVGASEVFNSGNRISLATNDDVLTFAFTSDSESAAGKPYLFPSRFDIYFVFTGTKEYMTYEDIGDVIISDPNKVSIIVNDDSHHLDNVEITDSNGNIIPDFDNAFTKGDTYIIQDITVDSGYAIKEIYFDRESISLPYTFVCHESSEDYELTIDTYKLDEPSDLEVDAENCIITVYDEDDNVVPPGSDAMISGRDYYFTMDINSGYEFRYAYVNQRSVPLSEIPYHFTCIGDTSILARASEIEVARLYNPTTIDVIFRDLDTDVMFPCACVFTQGGESIYVDYDNRGYSNGLRIYTEGSSVRVHFDKDIIGDVDMATFHLQERDNVDGMSSFEIEVKADGETVNTFTIDDLNSEGVSFLDDKIIVNYDNEAPYLIIGGHIDIDNDSSSYIFVSNNLKIGDFEESQSIPTIRGNTYYPDDYEGSPNIINIMTNMSGSEFHISTMMSISSATLRGIYFDESESKYKFTTSKALSLEGSFGKVILSPNGNNNWFGDELLAYATITVN